MKAFGIGWEEVLGRGMNLAEEHCTRPTRGGWHSEREVFGFGLETQEQVSGSQELEG